MGQTADQLRQEVDQKREEASSKIEQIEQHVADTAQQVKQSLDWRHQVEEKPLVALGAALLGGVLLGGVIGGGDKGSSHGGNGSGGSGSDSGGITNAIRNAAKSSGIEETVQHFAGAALGALGDRLREVTEQSFPGIIDKIQGGSPSAPSSPTTAPRPSSPLG